MPHDLRDYDAKRDFSRTPEPPGDTHPSPTGRRYVIHKHAASRLHYDLRLEHDGVLLSWAVPKGPSFDTKQRRLAVHVEDHPVDYGSFEGIIPEGEYGGGTVMLWDLGSWSPHGDVAQSLADGKLVFDLHGEKLQGRFGLIHTGARKSGREENQWLLIKERDSFVRAAAEYDVTRELPDSAKTGRTMEEIAAAGETLGELDEDEPDPDPTPPDPTKLEGAVASELPSVIEPQLASPVARAPRGDAWVHEIKHDGYRVLIRIDGGDARIYTREGADWTDRFSALAADASGLPVREAVIDAEAVLTGAGGLTDFGALQSALDSGRGDEVSAYCFDLLHLDGFDLHETPLAERKRTLETLLAAGRPGRLRYSEHVVGDHTAILRAACELGVEGVVSKRADAPYRPGRSTSWLKAKCVHRQEFVVGGWTHSSSSTAEIGALLLGYNTDSGLAYAGRVGSGISEVVGRTLRASLSDRHRDTPPFLTAPPDATDANWTEPQIVVEVTFSGWTRSDRLRHPVFVGVRQDRDPATVVREGPVQAIATTTDRDAPVSVLGVDISHPGKQMIQDGPDKGGLARYYAAVAPHVLRHLGGRPLTLLRCPDGAGGSCFWQRHLEEGTVPGVFSSHVAGSEFVWIEEATALVGLVQFLAVEFHAWGSRVAAPDRPDRLVFDLDPGPGVEWDDVRAGALLIREILAVAQLESFVRTTGGKGLHVVAPIAPRVPVREAAAATKGLAQRAVDASGGVLTIDPRKAARAGRIFLDWHRNARGQSGVASYSVRSRAGAPVATPITWDELQSGVDPSTFTVDSVVRRLERTGDPWEQIDTVEQHLAQEALDL